jgi:hypothetical protein
LKKLLLLSSLPLLLSFTTCGHRAAPKPPLSHKPETPKPPKVIQDFNRPLIYWSPVDKFSDGRKISAPKKVNYLLIVNFGEKKVKTDRLFYYDEPIKPKEKRCYSLIAIYENHKSPPSEPTCILGKEPIKKTPKILKAMAGNGFVEFTFAPHKYIVEVFKNPKNNRPLTTPYAKVEGTTFKDVKVVNGKEYRYFFRFSKGTLKGKTIGPFKLKPEDRTPPLPPKSVQAICLNGGCTVIWEPSPSRDVAYYLIKLGRESYKTEGIYFYLPKKCPPEIEVIAIDRYGNKSEPKKVEVKGEESCGNYGK